MQYNFESLDYAIGVILPFVGKVKEQGVNFNRIELCKMVAGRYFIEAFQEPITDYERYLCYSVVRQALLDLEKYGHLSYGNLDLASQFED